MKISLDITRRFSCFVQEQSKIGPYSYSILAAIASDAGCHRVENEDHLHFSSLNNNHQNVLAIVADGMGGHAAGATASHEAVQSIHSHFIQYQSTGNPTRVLKKAVTQANTYVYQLAIHDPELSGMGTTVTVLAILNGLAYYAHVGDSRLYLIRDGSIQQLTEDHTLVNQMVKDGLITGQMANTHPDRNIVTRALGTKPSVEVDISKSPVPIAIGDVFVLCSDGLYDLVSDSFIQQIASQNNLDEACHQLVEAARSAGGYDNISVIVIKIQDASSESPRAAITKF